MNYDDLPYFIQYDEMTNKYSAKVLGTDHIVGEGSSLYAAIDDLEAKINKRKGSAPEHEVSIRVRSKFS